jgi:hypothetical protein
LSILLLVIEIRILLTAARLEKWRVLWWLVPLFAVWANLHIQFVYGLLVLGIFLLTMHVPLRFAVILPATFVATLMNPYGPGVWRVVLEYARQGSLAAVITELRHPDPTAWSTWLIVAVAAWAAAMLLSRRRELFFWMLLLAAAAVLYFRTLRDGWFLVIVSGAVLLAQSAAAGKHRPVESSVMAAAIPGVLLGLGLAAAYGYFRSDTTSAMLAKEYPAEAVKYVRDHHLTGPLLNTFDWGGYLTWHLPSLPVSVDGRTNVHPASRILAFDRLWQGDLSAVPEFENVRLVIAPIGLPLTERLRPDGRFSLAHEDHRAAVFVRLR